MEIGRSKERPFRQPEMDKMARGWSWMSDFGKWNPRGSIVVHGGHVYEVWTNLDEGWDLGRNNKNCVLNEWDFVEDQDEEEEEE